jgi:hypothetical protein
MQSIHLDDFCHCVDEDIVELMAHAQSLEPELPTPHTASINEMSLANFHDAQPLTQIEVIVPQIPLVVPIIQRGSNRRDAPQTARS